LPLLTINAERWNFEKDFVMQPEMVGYLAAIASIACMVIALFAQKWKRRTKLGILGLYVIFSAASMYVWYLMARPAPPRAALQMEVLSGDNSVVDPRSSPFSVFVRGTVANAKQHYTYLVVNDYVHEYIEPISGLGFGVDADFSGYCYLGIENDPASMNKKYSISAVVTSTAYKESDHLDRLNLLAESNKLLLYRPAVQKPEPALPHVPPNTFVQLVPSEPGRAGQPVRSLNMDGPNDQTVPLSFRITWARGPNTKKFQIYTAERLFSAYDQSVAKDGIVRLGGDVRGRCQVKTWWDNGTNRREERWVNVE
jgi:hypothetical protein